MHVEVVRRGGLAGVALRGEADTADLPGPRASAAEAALRSLADVNSPAEPGHPDGFRYEIAYSDPVGASRSIVLDESQVTGDLLELINAAMARGKLD